MKRSHGSSIWRMALIGVFCAGCQPQPRTDDHWLDSHMFLSGLIVLSSHEFDGEVDEAHTPENPFAGEPLVMHVKKVTYDEARIALRVGDDRSRTWVLTREGDRLRLRHDHRDPDGTPHELTDYGGLAAAESTWSRQVFPADEFTAAMLPEAATNVWSLELDHENERFIYDLTRHGEPRFRAVFDLANPRLATPTARDE